MTANPWLPVAVKYADQAKTDRQVWLDVRHLLGVDWEAFRREHRLPRNPPPGESRRPVAAVGPPARVGALACVHLGDALPLQVLPTGQRVPCQERRYECGRFQETVTIARCTGGLRACADCPSPPYEARSDGG